AVAVAGPAGGTAAFELPSLPAKSGTALARSAVAEMNGLRSYRVAEVLSGFRSAYAYARPHQMWLRTWYADGVQQSLWLGSSLYVKTGPQAQRRAQVPGHACPGALLRVGPLPAARRRAHPGNRDRIGRAGHGGIGLRRSRQRPGQRLVHALGGPEDRPRPAFPDEGARPLHG